MLTSREYNLESTLFVVREKVSIFFYKFPVFFIVEVCVLMFMV